jgi:hypothetical protein
MPVKAQELKREDLKKSLMYHMYLKEKRCSQIKVHTWMCRWMKAMCVQEQGRNQLSNCLNQSIIPYFCHQCPRELKGDYQSYSWGLHALGHG